MFSHPIPPYFKLPLPPPAPTPSPKTKKKPWIANISQTLAITISRFPLRIPLLKGGDYRFIRRIMCNSECPKRCYSSPIKRTDHRRQHHLRPAALPPSSVAMSQCTYIRITKRPRCSSLLQSSFNPFIDAISHPRQVMLVFDSTGRDRYNPVYYYVYISQVHLPISHLSIGLFDGYDNIIPFHLQPACQKPNKTNPTSPTPLTIPHPIIFITPMKCEQGIKDKRVSVTKGSKNLQQKSNKREGFPSHETGRGLFNQ